MALPRPPITIAGHHHLHPRSSSFTWTEDCKSSLKPSRLLTSSPKTPTASSAAQSPCSSNPLVPQIHEEEDLYLGQLYFLLPLSMSRVPLSIRDLCMLAIKASAVLESSSSLRRRKAGVSSVANHRRQCRAPTGFDSTRLDLGQSSRRIEL
ncbi:hypothetical protein BT93_L1524 [Corymbia citriodora subsp. variegata]|uniref:Uncharacterized protein n=1 Tax=Corymbia citriodora subsp. variegata TaxID=360336 RepID=A0A8T0CPW6_CORYI|nr:hypothetical protein BT93_L1524 [Corymbia citriodora subsp. variegata]